MTKRVRDTLILVSLAGIAPMATGQAAKSSGEGLDGAALCIAAGEFLISRGVATKAIEQDTQGWRDVYSVIEATDAERETELNESRGVFVEFETKSKDLGVKGAKAALLTCGGAELRAKYVAKYGSPALIEAANKGSE